MADGSLLSAAGWKRASAIFATSDPYPATSDIQIMSVGGSIGEDWVKGDHAQVDSRHSYLSIRLFAIHVRAEEQRWMGWIQSLKIPPFLGGKGLPLGIRRCGPLSPSAWR